MAEILGIARDMNPGSHWRLPLPWGQWRYMDYNIHVVSGAHRVHSLLSILRKRAQLHILAYESVNESPVKICRPKNNLLGCER